MTNKIAFITHFCPHYRVKTFETLARYHDVDYYFFSAGDEWYWQQQHGVKTGNFRHAYLPGFRLGQTRVAPTLPWKLWRNPYEAYVKCINGRFALPVTYLIARLKRKPFILWMGVWMQLQTPAHRLFFPLTRYIYRHADALVVYGRHVKQFLVEQGVPPHKIFLAHHAVDNDAYNRPVTEEEKLHLRQQLGLNAADKVILYLGRLEEGKGISYLIEAFAALKDESAVLLLAGSGAEQARLQEMVHRAGLAERVRFPGYISTGETVPYYALAWVYVLPSITTATFKEPWGLVVNEAFNQGVPVIATDAVGAAAGGLLHDGVNGYIVPERNSAALASRLQQLFDDLTLRPQMSQNARETIARWDNEQMVAGFRQAIEFCQATTR